jgi:hypothetical protein
VHSEAGGQGCGRITQRQPRYAYLAPTYAQAKDVAWTYLKDYVAGIPGVEVRESELAVILPHNKARIQALRLGELRPASRQLP